MTPPFDRREFLLSTCAAAAGGWAVLSSAEPGAVAEDAPAQPRRLPYRVSRETTWITRPLRADGSPDYVAALDAAMRAGVTPENNAVVLYWRALGPKAIAVESRAAYFAKLGMDVPPEEGDYLVGLHAFAQERAAQRDPPLSPVETADFFQELAHQMGRAAAAPWTARELPEMAAWLARNEKPLAIVVEAARRPKYFAPILFSPREADDPPPLLIEALLPLAQESREFSRLLAARAMRSLGEGKRAEAEEDLLACRRLGRQVGQDRWLIAQLVGIAIEAIAGEAEAALAHHGNYTAEEARAYIARLDALPPRRPMIETIDNGERLVMLSVVCHIALYPENIDQLSNGGPRQSPSMLTKAGVLLINWDVPLKKTNAHFDELAAAARAGTRDERQEKLDAIDNGLRQKAAEIGDPRRMLSRALWGRSETMGDVLLSLLAPAISAAFSAEEQATMRFELSRLGFALAAYKADQGEYPPALDALAPRYVATVPQDVFSGKPLVYRRADDRKGFVLYSVGRNGMDDGGRDGRRGDPPPEFGPGAFVVGDDIVIRTPENSKE